MVKTWSPALEPHRKSNCHYHLACDYFTWWWKKGLSFQKRKHTHTVYGKHFIGTSDQNAHRPCSSHLEFEVVDHPWFLSCSTVRSMFSIFRCHTHFVLRHFLNTFHWFTLVRHAWIMTEWKRMSTVNTESFGSFLLSDVNICFTGHLNMWTFISFKECALLLKINFLLGFHSDQLEV